MRRATATLLCLLCALAGCTRSRRTDAATAPRFEHVLHAELTDVLAETRALLLEQGHTLEPLADPDALLTAWRLESPEEVESLRKEARESAAEGVPVRRVLALPHHRRLFVMGVRVGPDRCVVRIFRLRRPLGDAAAAEDRLQRADATLARQATTQGERDFALERALAQRLLASEGASPAHAGQRADADTAYGPGAGTAQPAPADTAEDAGTNAPPGPAAYLDRWQEDLRAQAPAACEPEVRGARALLTPGLTLLVGEVPGTREVPAAVGALTCEAAALGLPVTLALTLPREEQPRLDAYVASPGAPADQRRLVRGGFWTRAFQDGRASRAVLDLVDRARSLRARGTPVRVLAFGDDTRTGSARQEAMAAALLHARRARPEDVLLVLAGNVHVRSTPGAEWDADFVPLGHHLRAAVGSARLLALDLAYATGGRWGCTLDGKARLRCGLQRVAPPPARAVLPRLSTHVTLFERPDALGFDGVLSVGTLRPSGPATDLSAREPSLPPRHGPTPGP